MDIVLEELEAIEEEEIYEDNDIQVVVLMVLDLLKVGEEVDQLEEVVKEEDNENNLCCYQGRKCNLKGSF